MKDLIESGFGTHCEEELLTFDDLGNLISVEKGIQDLQTQTDIIMEYKQPQMDMPYNDIDKGLEN